MAVIKQEVTDGIGVDDASATVADPATNHEEVKGPDPEIWGPDDERPNPTPTMATAAVSDDGEPIEVKGPDPEVWG